MKEKINHYKVRIFDNFSQYERKGIIFSTEEQAEKYIEFMKKYDGDSKSGHISYKIEKEAVYLSEDVMIINWIKQQIRYLNDKLGELRDENGNLPPVWTGDYQIYTKYEKEYEKKLKEKEELLKFYQAKLKDETNEEKQSLNL